MPVVGIAAFSLVFPISIVIIVIEAILVFSYRQTIKAYPTAGGAYIVTRDNFGLLPAQVAGVALLSDYVLTVAVSVAAGTQAISSVLPELHPYRVPISLGFVWLIAYGNLLGVRESGKLFGIPTYLFIASLFATIGVGLFRVLSSKVEPLPVVRPDALSLGTAAVGLFVVLRAFASGGAAVTGVEAISNGVPAFRKPEWVNARVTLTWMGAILGSSFLAVSYLAFRLHVVPVADESKSVLAQIGELSYGSGAVGRALFLILQVSTTLILVLAANTSFADFPRLASFHAGDRFLPRQFTKRGHRLVFSNGVLALAVAASIILVAFKASVTNLIPLYALGVFTSFTLSQSGMAKRHLRLREPGWRMGFAINGVGAVATLVVDVVIAVVKFTDGAWMVMVAVPILVTILVRINKLYDSEERELLHELSLPEHLMPMQHDVVVLVDELDGKTLHALQYALTIRPEATHAVHLAVDQERVGTLALEWDRLGTRIALEQVPCPEADRPRCLARHVEGLVRHGRQVTVVLPGPARRGFLSRLLLGRSWSRFVAVLSALPGVLVVVVREHGGPGHPREDGRIRLSPRRRHEAIVLVDRLDRSVLRAVRYGRAIQAAEISAVHVGVDPEHARALLEQWAIFGESLAVPLNALHCPDRNVAAAVRAFVDERKGPGIEVTVVLPRREYRGVFQRLLHDRTSRVIARALRDEPHVDVAVVPYKVGSAVASTRIRHRTRHPAAGALPSD